MGILEEIVVRVGPVFSNAGYIIVAGAVLLERSLFIGLVVPGDVILALGGIYAARGRLGLGWVVLIGILAATVGESTGYWLGRRYGLRFVARIPLARRLTPRLEAAREYFAERGGFTVAVGRFATAAGAFIPFVAGIGRMPYPRFLAYDIPAITVWAVGITLIGYVFGSNLALVDRILRRFGIGMLIVLVLILVARAVIKHKRRSAES